MSVFLTIPSKKPRAEAEAVLAKWREMGYLLAIWRDEGDEPVDCEILLTGKYPGYAVACNHLIAAARKYSEDAQWFVCAGDDILPDPNKRADQIAFECGRHFGEQHQTFRMEPVVFGGTDAPIQHGQARNFWSTLGVMQPTGDPWADSHGRMIERIAGSPWIGREFAERMYGGHGPYYEGYTHCFLDNEIRDVAKKHGVYWQRPDLTQWHAHWSRERRAMPDYLRDANSPGHWQRYSQMYFLRKAQGFPGSDPHEQR